MSFGVSTCVRPSTSCSTRFFSSTTVRVVGLMVSRLKPMPNEPVVFLSSLE